MFVFKLDFQDDLPQQFVRLLGSKFGSCSCRPAAFTSKSSLEARSLKWLKTTCCKETERILNHHSAAKMSVSPKCPYVGVFLWATTIGGFFLDTFGLELQSWRHKLKIFTSHQKSEKQRRVGGQRSRMQWQHTSNRYVKTTEGSNKSKQPK